MRVILIRPELQARLTAAKLADLGHDPVVFPLFQPSHDLIHCLDALEIQLCGAGGHLRRSAAMPAGIGSGAGALSRSDDFYRRQIHGAHGQDAGFTKVISASGNGHDLAAIVAGFAAGSMETKPILYLAGARRSGIFETTLNDNDVECVTAEIYDMEPVPYTLEQQQHLLVNHPVDAAFFFSRENAKAFFGLDVFSHSKEALRKTLFFCLSRNIAEVVPEAFRNSAVVSLNPDEDELLDLL